MRKPSCSPEEIAVRWVRLCERDVVESELEITLQDVSIMAQPDPRPTEIPRVHGSDVLGDAEPEHMQLFECNDD